jgi:hypothetical protein
MRFDPVGLLIVRAVFYAIPIAGIVRARQLLAAGQSSKALFFIAGAWAMIAAISVFSNLGGSIRSMLCMLLSGYWFHLANKANRSANPPSTYLL